MLYIKGPRAGARQSRQCKDKRKYESASVQVPTDYNRLYIKPMIFFANYENAIDSTHHQRALSLHSAPLVNECDFEQEPECKHRFNTEFSLTFHIPDETSLVITVIRLTQYL